MILGNIYSFNTYIFKQQHLKNLFTASGCETGYIIVYAEYYFCIGQVA